MLNLQEALDILNDPTLDGHPAGYIWTVDALRDLVARVDSSLPSGSTALFYSGSLGIPNPVDLFLGESSVGVLKTQDLVRALVGEEDANGKRTGFSDIGQSDVGKLLHNLTFRMVLDEAFGGDSVAAKTALLDKDGGFFSVASANYARGVSGARVFARRRGVELTRRVSKQNIGEASLTRGCELALKPRIPLP